MRWSAALLCFMAYGCAGRTVTRAPVPIPAVPSDLVDVTLFLIGDAGAPAAAPDSEPVLVALRTAAGAVAHPFVVFLGDNVYPRGLPDSTENGHVEAERRLTAQLAALRASGAPGVFVPGNHDWDKHGKSGWDAVRREERFIATAGGGRVSLLPGGGCPGPAVVDVGAALRIVALDTQWWLHGGPKPRDPDSVCPTDSEREILDSLRAALTNAGARVVVVVAHHPLRTGGPHGGHFGWKDHIFPLRALKSWLWIPLPLIGSVYPLARRAGISRQDESSGTHRDMLTALDRALAESPPLIFAAGHEHGLQVIAGTSSRFILVSGAGTFGHLSRVTSLDSTRFVRSASGFMRVDVLHDRRARLGVMTVNRAGVAEEAFSLWLN